MILHLEIPIDLDRVKVLVPAGTPIVYIDDDGSTTPPTKVRIPIPPERREDET